MSDEYADVVPLRAVLPLIRLLQEARDNARSVHLVASINAALQEFDERIPAGARARLEKAR